MQVPLVIVQTPAPMLEISSVSPAANNEVFTVIVVDPAAFIRTLVPTSAATKTYETVLVEVVLLYWFERRRLAFAAVNTSPEVKTVGNAIMLLL